MVSKEKDQVVSVKSRELNNVEMYDNSGLTDTKANDIDNYTAVLQEILRPRSRNQAYIFTPLTCSSSDPLLVLLVKSNVQNFDNRNAIRSTWGNVSDAKVRLAFLLGDSPFLHNFVKMEHSLYNDILQGNFIDDHNNITLKTIMGFDWCLDYCKRTNYFFFVDDDYLVNISLLLEYVHQIYGSTIYTGWVWYGEKPNRSKKKEKYVSYRDYPFDRWPPFVAGGSYLISRDYAMQMRYGFKTIKSYNFEDDIYMGIIAQKLEMLLTNDGRFLPYYNLKKIPQLFSTHGFASPRKLLTDWEVIKDRLFQ